MHLLLERDRFLRADPNARALYYDADGHALGAGTVLVNRAYAATLRSIAAHGADALYSGPIAEDIVRAVRARGGDLTPADLERYAALERDPVCGPYRRVRICGMGPPSAGAVTLLELLGMLERTVFDRAPPLSAPAVHLFSEASRLAYADRARYIADPAFVRVPVQGLLDPAYLAQRARLIGERSMGAAQPGQPALAPLAADVPDTEHHGTSHVSIVDRDGDAVAMTTTIENAFGSRIMVRGFLLNNELTDFSFQPQARGLPAANRVEAGKRPRSTMAPTMVFDRDGRLRMLLGSPGGPAIVDFVAKTLVAALDWGYDIQAAIAAPNFGSRTARPCSSATPRCRTWTSALAERGHVLNFAQPDQRGAGYRARAGRLARRRRSAARRRRARRLGRRRRGERKAHRDLEAAGAARVLERDRSAVVLDDLLDDRQPEPAAVGAVAGAAVEAVEHPRSLLGRNPGPAVAHLERGPRAVAEHGNVDATRRGRVAHRIVDQIGEQGPQRGGGARRGHRLDAREAEIDAAASAPAACIRRRRRARARPGAPRRARRSRAGPPRARASAAAAPGGWRARRPA